MAKLTKRIGALVLRLAAFGAALAALIVMVTSRERASFFAVSLEAKYTDMAAFKYVKCKQKSIMSSHKLCEYF